MDKAIKTSMSAEGKSDGGNGENIPPSVPRGTGTGSQCAMQSWSKLEDAKEETKLQVLSMYTNFVFVCLGSLLIHFIHSAGAKRALREVSTYSYRYVRIQFLR